MWGYLLLSVFVLLPQDSCPLKPCSGDTRGDRSVLFRFVYLRIVMLRVIATTVMMISVT